MTTATIQDAMAAAGLRPAKDLQIPGTGKLIRYRVEGDKAGSVNGWAVLHEMGTASFGSFGSWKTGATHTWRSGFDRTRAPTAQERAEIQARMELLDKARREELAKVRAQARDKAATLWKRAKPATNAHPYLMRKRVNAYGLRALGDALLIPLRDTSGSLRAWMLGAMRERLSDQKADLDRLLGLRSRRGGRLHAFAGQPGRDAALLDLVQRRGFKYARELHALIVTHRETPDPELHQIEQQHRCPLPRSLSQVSRILGKRTESGSRNASDCKRSPSALDPSSNGWLFKGC